MPEISLRDTENRTIETEEIKGPDIPCDYGCGESAKHRISNGKLCCSEYPIQCEAVRYKKNRPPVGDYKMEVKCDCFHHFVVQKSMMPTRCPRCGRSGTFTNRKRHIEWK